MKFTEPYLKILTSEVIANAALTFHESSVYKK